MKIDFIDKNGNIITKDIDLKKMSEVDIRNAFKNTSQINTIPKIDISSFTREELNRMWENCKMSEDV